MVRIAPEDIRKKGKVPKNGSLFFTIFQTFMASTGSATEKGSAAGASVAELPEVPEPTKRAGGYMYILGCGDGTLYTGSTKDLRLRLGQHRTGEGAQHTSVRLPVR